MTFKKLGPFYPKRFFSEASPKAQALDGAPCAMARALSTVGFPASNKAVARASVTGLTNHRLAQFLEQALGLIVVE